MQPITLPLDLVNAVLEYLGRRPFAEVAPLIGAIQQIANPQFAAMQQGQPPAAAPLPELGDPPLPDALPTDTPPAPKPNRATRRKS